MDLEKKYYAKLMLAGEYGVLKGSEALTIPLKKFHAKFDHVAIEELSDSMLKSVSTIRKLLLHLKSLPVNSFFARPVFEDMDKVFNNGCYVASTIPQGYGIGSSGAVSALVYDQLFTDKESLTIQQHRKDLATIESFFHGKSSGVDPLSCYIGKPLHFLANEKIEILDIDPDNPLKEYRFFLLDSKEKMNTEELVKLFFEKLKDSEYDELITNEYRPLVDKLIASLRGTLDADPAFLFNAVSEFQWKHFREMIPESMEEAWIQGQVSNTYYLKLNGSGGGFLLGIAHENVKEEVEAMLDGYDIIWV